MKTIAVTGSVGTGKTILSKKLAKRLNFHYLDVNKLISEDGISEDYDSRRKARIVDVNRLNKELIKEINNYKKAVNDKIKKIKNNKQNFKKIKYGMIIDSHFSHYLPKKYVDLCIVTKCNLKEMQRRLKKRKYSKEKIKENLDAEIFDVCLNEAKERKHRTIIIDTTRPINIKNIINKIKLK